MLKTHYHKNNTWYDFTAATAEKFLPLAKEKKINPYIINKFLSKSNRDKALHLDDNLYLSLHFPDLKNEDYVSQELKFIIGRDYIITNQEILNEGLESFRKQFESNAIFEKDKGKDSCIVYIFLHMIEKIYENMIFELRELERRIDEIEENIFKDKEKYMVRKISETNRDLLDFRKNIRSHEET
jgi:Mg2+ and Co2+ transporter CorA